MVIHRFNIWKNKSPRLKRGLLFSVLSFFLSYLSFLFGHPFLMLSLILEHAQETFPLSIIPHFRTSLRNIFSFCHPSFLMIIKNVKGSILLVLSLETLLRFDKGSTMLFNPKIAGRFC